MRNILNITNGDCAVEIMKKAKIAGEFLPWRDVLHDGPVPENISLEELSKVRTQFIVDRKWGTADNITNSFIERDNKLKLFEKYEKIILWFEHDLYDQLQILQILDWFHLNATNNIELSIICTEQYLGLLTPAEMNGLFKYEEQVTQEHLNLSSKAWSAFRSSTPENWHALLNTDTSAMPFLNGAIIRMLEEYPCCSNGLSRTAQQSLKIILEGETHPGKVFAHNQNLEERLFLGDSGFWIILQEFLDSNPALLRLPEGIKLTLPTNSDQELIITQAGKDVLDSERSWLDIIDIEKHIGGVHLRPGNIWCWDSNSGTIEKRI